MLPDSCVGLTVSALLLYPLAFHFVDPLEAQPGCPRMLLVGEFYDLPKLDMNSGTINHFTFVFVDSEIFRTQSTVRPGIISSFLEVSALFFIHPDIT